MRNHQKKSLNKYLSLRNHQDNLHTFRFRLAEGKEKGEKIKHMTHIEKAKCLGWIEKRVRQDKVVMWLKVSLSSVKRLVAKSNF